MHFVDRKRFTHTHLSLQAAVGASRVVFNGSKPGLSGPANVQSSGGHPIAQSL